MVKCRRNNSILKLIIISVHNKDSVNERKESIKTKEITMENQDQELHHHDKNIQVFYHYFTNLNSHIRKKYKKASSRKFIR